MHGTLTPPRGRPPLAAHPFTRCNQPPPQKAGWSHPQKVSGSRAPSSNKNPRGFRVPQRTLPRRVPLPPAPWSVALNSMLFQQQVRSLPPGQTTGGEDLCAGREGGSIPHCPWRRTSDAHQLPLLLALASRQARGRERGAGCHTQHLAPPPPTPGTRSWRSRTTQPSSQQEGKQGTSGGLLEHLQHRRGAGRAAGRHLLARPQPHRSASQGCPQNQPRLPASTRINTQRVPALRKTEVKPTSSGARVGNTGDPRGGVCRDQIPGAVTQHRHTE